MNQLPEMRPVDRYRVRIPQPLSMHQLQVLTQLYQPLIGSTAFSLYLTLFHESEAPKQRPPIREHAWLMQATAEPLDHLYRARLRLEAIGLLSVYKYEGTNPALYDYELHQPLPAEQYFADDVLNIYFYNQVGSRHYKYIRGLYFSETGEHQSAGEERKNITREFHDVFTSLHYSELQALDGTEMQRELRIPVKADQHKSFSQFPKYETYPLDLEELKGYLLPSVQPESIFTEQNLRVLKQIAFLYQLDEYMLSQMIRDALTLDDELNLRELRHKAKEWYRLEQGGHPPQVVHMVQAPHQRTVTEATIKTEEDRHRYTLETISPIQLLEAYQGGGKVAEADVKLVESLLVEYELNPAVVNVLLEYILFTNDWKLPKNLVTKIAAHWKRRKLIGVDDALEMAKREHQQYKSWKESKQSAKRRAPSSNQTNFKRNQREDILPEWIENQGQSAKTSSLSRTRTERQMHDSSPVNNNPSSTTPELSEAHKRKRMEQLLKTLGEWDEERGE